MAAIGAPLARLEAGFVWADALVMLKRDWPICSALTAALIVAPRIIVEHFVLPPIAPLVRGYSIGGYWIGGLALGWAAATVFVTPATCVLIAVLLTRFSSGARGPAHPWSTCFVLGCRSAPMLYPVLVAADLLTTLGFVLLIVPGIMLTLAWSAIEPAVVLEGAGFLPSFRRSLRLTKGHWPKLLIFWLLYVAVGSLIELGIWAVLGIAKGALHWSGPVTGMLDTTSQAVATPLRIAGVASLYRELKILKEGADTGNLATVFD